DRTAAFDVHHAGQESDLLDGAVGDDRLRRNRLVGVGVEAEVVAVNADTVLPIAIEELREPLVPEIDFGRRGQCEVPQPVEDGFAAVYLDALEDMLVMAEDEVGAFVNRRVS